MAGREDGGVGSARRRRNRQLRTFRRRELLTVRMELSSALHHSAQQVEGPRDREVHEKDDGPRAQKRPLPGTRPAPLAEVVGSQVRAATVSYVAAPMPRLAGHRLQCDDDGVDGSPSTVVLRGRGAPFRRRGVTMVVSMASWAPRCNGNPSATTSKRLVSGRSAGRRSMSRISTLVGGHRESSGGHTGSCGRKEVREARGGRESTL